MSLGEHDEILSSASIRPIAAGLGGPHYHLYHHAYRLSGHQEQKENSDRRCRCTRQLINQPTLSPFLLVYQQLYPTRSNFRSPSDSKPPPRILLRSFFTISKSASSVESKEEKNCTKHSGKHSFHSSLLFILGRHTRTSLFLLQRTSPSSCLLAPPPPPTPSRYFPSGEEVDEEEEEEEEEEGRRLDRKVEN